MKYLGAHTFTRICCQNGSKSKNICKFTIADAHRMSGIQYVYIYIDRYTYISHKHYLNKVFYPIKKDQLKFPLGSGIDFGYLRFFAQPRREEAQTPCARLSTAPPLCDNLLEVGSWCEKARSWDNHENGRFIINWKVLLAAGFWRIVSYYDSGNLYSDPIAVLRMALWNQACIAGSEFGALLLWKLPWFIWKIPINSGALKSWKFDRFSETHSDLGIPNFRKPSYADFANV